jgi:signal peptidase I
MTPEPKSVRAGALLRDILEAVVLAAVLFFVLQFVFQNTIVEGQSMEPNFVDRQWLLVNKLAYRFGAPARGDVIVFDAPEGEDKEFIKRVIGLPGESVTMRDGVVAINSRPIAEPWLPRRDGTHFGPFIVPPNQYFVLGDNRPNSNDSRTWGHVGAALAADRIVGKAWLSIWPRQVWGVVHADGPGPAAALGPR